jgi:calcineurin-like phosphoesterase
MPVRFEMAEGNVQMHGAIIEVDSKTAKAISIKRIQIQLQQTF